MPVRERTSEVLPWSMWPAVPTMMLRILTLFILSQDEVLFKAGTAQVRVDAQVLANGKPVTGLKQEDFVVRDEGAPVAVSYFGTDAEPLSLLVLLDVSGSMRRFVEQLSASAQRGLAHLQDKDRVAVMVFSKGTELYLPLSANRAEAARELEVSVLEAKLPSGTAINAAVLDAAKELAKDRATRREATRYAIVILTDNGSLNYRVNDEMVLRELWSNDIVLNGIVVGKERENRRPRERSNPDFTYPDVYKLAQETGGESVAAERADRAFPEMIRNVRQRYALGYRLPDGASAGSFRRLRVELSAAAKKRFPKAVVRARAGYYVP